MRPRVETGSAPRTHRPGSHPASRAVSELRSRLEMRGATVGPFARTAVAARNSRNRTGACPGSARARHLRQRGARPDRDPRSRGSAAVRHALPGRAQPCPRSRLRRRLEPAQHRPATRRLDRAGSARQRRLDRSCPPSRPRRRRRRAGRAPGASGRAARRSDTATPSPPASPAGSWPPPGSRCSPWP